MIKTRKVVAALALASFGLVGAAATPAAAGQSCNKVDVEVINNASSGVSIKVTKLSYAVGASSSTYHTEGLTNKVLSRNGGRADWSNQNFQNAPEGSPLKFRIYYKLDTGRGWGSERFQEFDRTGSTCTDNRDYTFNITQ
ncbi:MAG: hypothetical protein KC776_06285 [Myxococcales bacterium]|nr:hypothetical protein [Myxococcales bacterium]MCB9578729.1 hypothetical protein [Polyangiaceae bacterium]